MWLEKTGENFRAVTIAMKRKVQASAFEFSGNYDGILLENLGMTLMGFLLLFVTGLACLMVRW